MKTETTLNGGESNAFSLDAFLESLEETQPVQLLSLVTESEIDRALEALREEN